MQYLKFIFLVNAVLMMSCSSLAQKQAFDVVSFIMPKGWQQQQNENGIQMSVTDKKTGAYAVAVIIKAGPSSAFANENFNDNWNKLIKNTVQVNGEPTMAQPTTQNGWDIISGSSNYTDGADTGMATLLNASGGGQTVSVILMTNTKKYQEDLLALLNSLELAKPSQTGTGNPTPETKSEAGKSAIVGLWIDYNAETSGNPYNTNVYGTANYTTGYRNKEYAFYDDGTYFFRKKQWVTSLNEILYVYETGTYTISGSQLTITPQKGRGEWWSKVGGDTKLWGKLVKSSDHKLEKVPYSFNIDYDPGGGQYKYTIILKPNKPTQRDGGQFNAPNDPYEFRYRLRENLGSLIDNPPGFKSGFENKLFTSTAKTQNPVQTSGTNTIDFAGTWISRSSSNEPGTMGYIENEYIFNNDGSYSFYSKTFNQSISNLILKKEKGTFIISGKQITLVPGTSVTEGWSKKNGIDEFGKLLSSQKNNLEKTTYQFTKHYFEGIQEWNLVLQANTPTRRDGPFSSNKLFSNAWYYSMTSAYKPAIKLP